jgi:hypothetical protein
MTFLRDLAKYKSLVDCSLQSTDLSTVLTGLCDVGVRQQTQITELKNALVRAPPASSDASTAKDLSGDFARLKSDVQAELERVRHESAEVRRSVAVVSTSTELHFQAVQTEMNKQLRTTGTRLEENDMDVRSQIQDLNLANEKVLAELKAVRDVVSKFDAVAVAGIIERLRTVEGDLAAANSAFGKSRTEFDAKVESRVSAEGALKHALDDGLSALDKRVRFCEEQVSMLPDLEATVVNGEDVALDLILRTVMRNSRRIDHFNEDVSSIRIECENIGASVVKVHEALQQFNHTIYDYGLELQKNSSYVDTTFRSIKSVITTIGTLTSNVAT